MSTWPNRGAPPAAPAGAAKGRTRNPRQSGHAGLTQANRPPRIPVRFSFALPERRARCGFGRITVERIAVRIEEGVQRRLRLGRQLRQ